MIILKGIGTSSYIGIGKVKKVETHALGNVVSFNTDQNLIINQINDLLPQSIRILASVEVPSNFNPRFAMVNQKH